MRGWVHGILASVTLTVLMSGSVRGDELSPLMDPAQYQREVAEPLERSFTLAREAIRSMPRHRFDVRALVEDSLDTPEKQFEWVRNHTEWVPYQGILKGGRGVLIDRMGNSLDRALLLGHMLSLSGHDGWRLRRTSLSETEARDLVDYWAENGVHRFPEVEPFNQEAIIEQAARDTRTDPVTLKREMENASLAFQSRWNDLLISSDIQSDLLSEALRTDELFKRETADSLHLAAARDHWYLECELDGEWVAFDPARRAFEMGEVEKTADSEPVLVSELPEDLFHRLEIRVLAEQWKNGNLSTDTALETELFVAKLDDPYVRIALSPMGDNPLENAMQPGGDANGIVEALLELDEWLPSVSVGHDLVFQKSIRKDGSLNANPMAPAQARAMESAVGLLGGIGRERADEVSHLTAVRLELTVRAPGREVIVTERYFSDLIGPHLRNTQADTWSLDEDAEVKRALDLSGQLTLYMQGFVPSPEWTDFQFFRSWIENRQGLLSIIGGSVSGMSSQVLAGFKELKQIPVDLYQVGGSRFQAHPGGSITYPDSINLLGRWQHLYPPDAEGRFPVLRVLDWIRNEVEVKPGVGDPRNVRFMQGVIDTHAESMLGRDPGGPKVSILNAAEQFGMDVMEGIDWVRVTQPEQVRELDLNEDTRSRLSADMKSGYHLLVRHQSVAMGEDGLTAPLWWRLNPDSGALLGYGMDGRGSAAEYLKVATVAFTVMDALIGAALCTGLKGDDLKCCLVEVGVRAGAGIAFGLGLGKATALGAEALYYAGVGFSAVSAATSGISFCN